MHTLQNGFGIHRTFISALYCVTTDMDKPKTLHPIRWGLGRSRPYQRLDKLDSASQGHEADQPSYYHTLDCVESSEQLDF